MINTGALLYDAAGTAGGAAVQFATMAGAPQRDALFAVIRGGARVEGRPNRRLVQIGLRTAAPESEGEKRSRSRGNSTPEPVKGILCATAGWEAVNRSG